MARRIVLNAKMRRVTVCGATETLLVDRDVALTHLPPILHDLFKAGCEIRGDSLVQRMDPRVKAATEEDWRTEYLDAVIAVRIVRDLDAAIEHVNLYGSHHTDAIVTADDAAAAEFCRRVDSAIVIRNASTQFADGGEFGFGAEIGIATGRLPPRGPVGPDQLTSYKYVVLGSGQTRP
jgi:glutamate-5-semialdehyde dehydrogenase